MTLGAEGKEHCVGAVPRVAVVDGLVLDFQDKLVDEGPDYGRFAATPQKPVGGVEGFVEDFKSSESNDAPVTVARQLEVLARLLEVVLHRGVRRTEHDVPALVFEDAERDGCVDGAVEAIFGLEELHGGCGGHVCCWDVGLRGRGCGWCGDWGAEG